VTRQKIFRIIVQICRFGIAGLFLFTAGAKLWIVKDFATSVSDLLVASSFNQHRWTWPVTILVIAVEIVTAICLLVRPTVRAGALLAAALLIGFSGFALYYVYVLHGEPLECGCFGKIIGSQLGLTTALRNLALLVPTFLVFFGFRRSVGPTVTSREPVGVTSGAEGFIG
jgi:hypothetical protein